MHTDPITKETKILKPEKLLNSNALSTTSGGSFYVSVKTPNTFNWSTISS